MMAFVAKQEPKPGEILTARRIIPPDFDNIGMWMIDRISRRYTNMTHRQILSWLRSVMDSSSYLFITNGPAVLLARMGPKELDPCPYVQEVFCLCQDGGFMAGAELYGDLLRWAKQLGAEQVGVMNFSDVPRPMVEETIGEKMKNRTLQFYQIG